MRIYCDCCVSTLSFIQRMLFMGVGYCADLGFRFDYLVKRRMPEWGTSRKLNTSPKSSRIVQELCESRGGRPGLSVLTSLLVSVDVKLY